MQVYAAMTDITDENIGRLLDHLKEIDEYDNTLIFIFSDNGAESTDVTKKVFHGDDPELYDEFFSAFDNSLESIGTEHSHISLGLGWAQVGSTPLHREKVFLTEGGTKVPMIVKSPDQTKSMDVNAFTTVLDITPTILDYANVEHPGTFYDGREVHPIEGKSLKPLLDGDVDRVYGVDESFSMELFGSKAVFRDNWKALNLASSLGGGQWQLFDLAEDVRELDDVSSEHPEILEKLISDYDEYAERVGVIEPEGLVLPR